MSRPLDAPYSVPALRAVASHGLPGGSYACPAEPLSSETWLALIEHVRVQRAWLLLAAVIAEGEWPATESQIDDACEHEEAAATSLLLLDRTLLDLAELLDAAGLEWRVLKGPAHAECLWSRPDLRAYSDVDVLVRGKDFDEVAHLIESSLGGRRDNPDPLPGLLARVGKSAAFTLPSGVEVDVHRVFAEGPFGVSTVVEDLWGEPERFEMGGRPLQALARVPMFLHACFHAALAPDQRRLVPRRDVAEGLARLASRDDADAVLEMAARWRCRVAVAHAVNEAVAVFGLDGNGPLEAWAARYRPTRREQRWLRFHLDEEGSGPFLESIATIGAIPGWSDRILYTRGLLFHEGHDPLWIRARRVLAGLRAGSKPVR